MDNNNKMHGEDREQQYGSQSGPMGNNNSGMDNRSNRSDNSGMHSGGGQGSAYMDRQSMEQGSQHEEQSYGGQSQQGSGSEEHRGMNEQGRSGQQGSMSRNDRMGQQGPERTDSLDPSKEMEQSEGTDRGNGGRM